MIEPRQNEEPRGKNNRRPIDRQTLGDPAAPRRPRRVAAPNATNSGRRPHEANSRINASTVASIVFRPGASHSQGPGPGPEAVPREHADHRGAGARIRDIAGPGAHAREDAALCRLTKHAIRAPGLVSLHNVLVGHRPDVPPDLSRRGHGPPSRAADLDGRGEGLGSLTGALFTRAAPAACHPII